MTSISLLAGLLATASPHGASPKLVLTVDTLVVGSRVDGVWKPAGPEFTSRFGPLTLRSFGLGTVGVRPIRSKAAFEEVDSANYLSDVDNLSAAYLHGGVPRVPRKVEKLDKTSPIYRKALTDFLVRKGVVEPKPFIENLVRVDLDGDGTKEVIIEARSRSNFNDSQMSSSWNNSDYSVVLLRSIYGKAVKDFSLEFVSKKVNVPMDTRRLRAIADVDGDGRMEIVTDSAGFEWQHGSLWKYRKGVATRLVTQYGGH